MNNGKPARQAILTRLKRTLADGLAPFPGGTGALSGVPAPVTHAGGDRANLARLFRERLEAIDGTADIVEAGRDVAACVIQRILSWSNGASTSVLSWSPTLLPVPELPERLRDAGVTLVAPSDLHDADQRRTAAALPVGLTGVDAAFASTGSVLLPSAPGKPRAASLLPFHHLALVPFSRLHANFESWLAERRHTGELEPLLRGNAQITFVTGPSKSADIELNLTLGVHGPKDVHAVLFEDR